LIIGLTGGIASGKSTAARYLSALGAHVIDADILGHRVYEPGTVAHAAIIEQFGESVRGTNNQIDRKTLGTKAFGNAYALKQLTDIVWPEIRRLAETEISSIRAEAQNPIVVLEAAVLLEANWDDMMDEIWVIVVEQEVAIERATARDGVDAAAIQARIDAQLSNEERAAKATVVIHNSASEKNLMAHLEAEWTRVAPKLKEVVS
jgi:dephospho-CoA kinase